MSARPGRLRCTERATASRYIRGERVTSTRIMEPAYQSRVRTQRLREKMARSVHGQGLRTAALRAELPRTPLRRSSQSGHSAKFAYTEFSEDEMRRPTPQMRSTLWVCNGYTGSDAQTKGGSAHE